MIVYAPEHDHEINHLLTERGVDGSRDGGFSSAFIVCFVQFMERLRPYFCEALGLRDAERLVFTEVGDQCGIGHGDERISLDRGQMVQLLFGSEAVEASPPRFDSPQLAEILARVFPIPLPWPGLNWV